MRRTTTLVFLLACAAVAHAQEHGVGPTLASEDAAQREKEQAWRGYQARVADALAETGGARELAFAAMLRSAVDFEPAAGEEAGTWREAAAARAGNDVMANQLLAVDFGADRALRALAATRWRAAEPRNLVPLVQLGLPVDALLERARGAERSHSHMYDTVRWMQSALLRHPPTADEEAAIVDGEAVGAVEISALVAMNLWTTFAMPAHQGLVEACSGDALQATPARQADCRHVATLLADHSDSMAEGGLGLMLLRGLAGSDFERKDIDARRLRMDWQRQQLAEAAAGDGDDPARQLVRLLADPAVGTDTQMLERMLQEAGVTLDPPAGWRSPWQFDRAEQD